MAHVFCRMDYSILSILPEFIDNFGHIHIQQTVEQSYNKVIDVWFYTDAVEMKEGEFRQVDVTVTDNVKEVTTGVTTQRIVERTFTVEKINRL